jgi:Tfp pilus assembly protein PilO
VSARARMILAIVAAVVVIALFYFLLIRSRQAELAQIRLDIETEENTSIQLTTELNRLKDLQDRAPELQAELAEMKQFVPENHEVPNFIFLVQDAATSAGVEFLRITPELPKVPLEQAPLAEVRMQIEALGGYFSIQDFIRRLHNLDRAVRLDSVAMTGEDEIPPVAITLEITARVFFELPADVPLTEGAVENVPPAPAEPGAASPEPATSP